MDAPLAVAQGLNEVGVVVAALAAAAGLLLPRPGWRAFAMLVALALVPALVLGEVWDSEQLRDVRDRPELAVGAAVAALALTAGLARLLLRKPGLLPLLAVGALPFRIPVDVGGSTANLLVPLYVVIGAGVLAYARDRIRADAFAPPPRLAPDERRAGLLEYALLGMVVLYALQSGYSGDFEQALKNLTFFYVPFALLFRLLASSRWSPRLAIACVGIALAEALVFAGIGFVEYATRHLFWNPKVIASNQFESYFRVNSLFFDPNIYGRFLAVVMALLAARALWARRWGTLIGSAAVMFVLLGAMVVTFSQSSLAALLTSLFVLAALRFPVKIVAGVTAAALVLSLAVVLAAPGATKLDLGSGRSIDRTTSGRVELIKGGWRMVKAEPLVGHGSGSFAETFRKREKVGDKRAASASHTIPLTVAAEQGIPGLLSYLLVLGAALAVVLRGLSGMRVGDPPGELVARAGIAAAFCGLVVHTLGYAAFLEDPLTWTLLGAALGLSRAPSPEPASPEPPGSAPAAPP